MDPSQQLESYLKEHETPYIMHHHHRSMTARQLAESENIDPHEVAKVVIMKDSHQYFMMVMPADYQIDLKATRDILGSQDAILATEDDLAKLFPDCELGAMPPFGQLYEMPVYAERDLSDDKEIEFHAGSHHEAIRMKYSDWHKMVQPQAGHFSNKFH